MGKIKIVCIGNSITNGFPFRRSQSFPSLLREKGGWEVINKGNNGESTAQVLARFEKDVINHRPDVATILTTTNDFIYDTDDPLGAMGKIEEMLNLAFANNIKILLLTPLLTIPRMAEEAWKTGNPTDYEKVNRDLEETGKLIMAYGRDYAESLGKGSNKQSFLRSYDLKSHFQKFTDLKGEELAYHDGLHPSVLGQAFIADLVFEELLSILDKKNKSVFIK